MTARRSRPTSAAFKGWWADGPDLRVNVRLLIRDAQGRDYEHGPLIALSIPARHLLDEDVCNLAHWAQQQEERAQIARELMVADLAQDPLPGM